MLTFFPGERLPNGGLCIEAWHGDEYGVMLALTPSCMAKHDSGQFMNVPAPFVTWEFRRDCAGLYSGQYRASAKDAFADYVERRVKHAHRQHTPTTEG